VECGTGKWGQNYSYQNDCANCLFRITGSDEAPDIQPLRVSPDYNQFNFSIGPLFAQLGFSVSINRLSGTVWMGPQASAGVSAPPVMSVSVVKGWLNQTAPPTADEINEWLKEGAVNASIGAGFVFSTQGSYGKNGWEASYERGIGVPQAQVSAGYNYCIYRCAP
jgi:hypothetical protein